MAHEVTEYKYLIDGIDTVFSFNPTSKKGRYSITSSRYPDSKNLTGVTTILNAINKPNLLDWAASEALKKALEIILNNPKEEAINLISSFIVSRKYPHTIKSDSAKDLGKEAHDWVEHYIKQKMAGVLDLPSLLQRAKDDGIYHIVIRFSDWAESNNVKFLASEVSVFSVKYFYAGTFDFVCEIDGKRYLGDFKTSSGIYGREYFAQCAAYRMAIEELNGWVFTSDGTLLDLRNIYGSVIMRSDKLTDEEIAIENDKKAKKYYSNKYNKNPSDVEYSIAEYEHDKNYFLGALLVYREGFGEQVDKLAEEASK